MSSVVIQWLNNEVKLSKRITKESIDTDFRNGYLFAEILKQYELIDKKMFDSLFYNGNSNETAVRNYSLLELGLVQKLGLKLKANRVYDIIKGKPGEAAKLLYDIKTYIELKKIDLTNDNGKIKLTTFMFGDIIKKPYLPKEHENFINKLKVLSKTLPKPKIDINAQTETNDLRSELDVIYKRKLSVIPTYEPQIKKEVEKPKYSSKTQYELNIMRLEREKKKKKIADQEAKMKNIKKEFIENIENFERNLRNNDRTGLKSKDEIESLNYTDKNNSDYDQTLLADIDIMKASRIVSESSNRNDKQMEIDEIRNFLKYQRNMDPSAYMKMIQKKIPSIETSMRQTHEYLNRIHEKKMKEDETNKEKKYRRRRILLSQQRSRKENEKTALDNFLLNQLLNESKQERRIAEQLMEMRKQKNLIYEDRCKKNQQYAEKREKDYKLALIREEEMGRKAREKVLLQKQKHDEELLLKEEEKKQETYRIINEIISELIDLSYKICEYKSTNEGNITKNQIDALKTLIAKGLPLEDKYISELIQNSEMLEDKKENADNLIEGLDPQQTSNESDNKNSTNGENNVLTSDNSKNGINDADNNLDNEKKLLLDDKYKEKSMENSQDKNNGNKEEENVQGAILMESVPEIPNSLISKIDENENVELIQVDEANRNVLRGVQILDEEEFMDYLKGQNNWEYTFCHTPPEVPKKMYDSLNEIIDNLTEITKVSDDPFEMTELPKVPITISIIGKRYSGKMTLANQLGSMYNLAVLSLEDLIKDAVRATTTDTKPSNEDSNEINTAFKSKKVTLARTQICSEIQTKISEGGYPGDELLVQLVIDSINHVNTNPEYPDCKGGWVLVNFPQNREQAALLEKELTGYEEPKKAKQSLQKRKSVSNIKIPTASKKASANTEKGFETKEGKLKSGLDLVLLMNADDEVVLKRKTGSKIDTVTGKIYHLEYNPPPENEPEIYERLAPFTDEDDNIRNQNILADGFDGQVDLIKDFFNRFKNLYEIDGSKTLRENVESVQSCFNEMINEKEKEEEEKKLEESKGDLDLQKEKKKKEEQENLEKIHGESITANDLEAYLTQEQNKNSLKDDDRKRSSRSRTQSAREKDLKHKNNSASTITIKTPKVGKDLKKKDSQDNQEKIEEITMNLEELSETQVSTPIKEESVVPSNKKKYPSKKIAETLIDSWASIEVNYIETLKYIFRSLRRERDTLTRYFYNTKVNFKKFLDRPNIKQNIVTAFKEEYNQIDNNLRCDAEAKEELHQRTNDLRDKLWEICDKRKEEAEQERKEMIEDKWIEDHFNLVINIYVTMMQVESDYTIGINQLVHDYYIDPNGPIINKESINKIKLLINRINVKDQKQNGLMNSITKLTQIGETNGRDNQDSKNNGNNQNNKYNVSILSSTSGSLCNSVLLRESLEQNNFLQNSDGVPYERYINDAYNLAYSRNEFKDVEVVDEEKKDNTTEPVTKKEDDNEEIPKDYADFIRLLQTTYHLNLERVQTKAKEHIIGLNKNGTEVFNLLDEWITKRYQIEINAVNELITHIEDAIEHEELLPDKLILEDENFKVKCDQFTNITDILPPPINPVEQILSEKFTIAQLLNICKMFNECSNTGIISKEEFTDCFMKLIAMSIDMEYLPDDYMNTEVNQIKQITDLLDPCNTGYINWKKFIMNQTGILPVPSVEYLTNLKQLYKNLPSYQNGKVTKNDYLSIKLWYEDIDEEINSKTITIYKRFKNLKEAMFNFFMIENNLEEVECQNENDGIKESEEKQNEGETDKKNELVNTLSNNEKEAIINTDKNDTNASSKNESSIEINESNNVNKELPVKNDEIIDNDNNNNVSNNNNNNNSTMPSNNEENNDETANKEQPIQKIYQKELFDVTSFLMCCCCDINQRAGIEKAFNIVSDDGLVTFEELYSIYNYGLYTDVNNTEKETNISYPKELFNKVFKDLNITPEEKVSFKQVMEIAEKNYPLLLTCPFYQLEKIDIETIEKK